jgi:hypothetical protein
MPTFIPPWLSPLLDHITTQGLTAAAALAAAFFGPLATIVIGRLQFRANARSANRHAWITALREDVCEIMEKRIQISQLYGFDSVGNLVCMNPSKEDELIQRIRFLGFRIELRLHPSEPKHDELVELLKEAPIPQDNARLNAEIKAVTQAILRKEWKKAAKGQ